MMEVDTVMLYLADKPVGEDGLYMLTVAWNLAEGEGLTYNGGRTTTGEEPLATFLYGTIAWVVQAAGGDRWMFLRVVLVFGLQNLFVKRVLVGASRAGIRGHRHEVDCVLDRVLGDDF